MPRPLDSTPSQREITQVIGLLSLRHPDLVSRVAHDELRRIAAECYPGVRRAETVPDVFRRAFEGEDQ